jgi:general secretion pathway protein D
LIFQGTLKEIETLGKLLAQVDVPHGEVVVKAVVYEVTTGKSDGTAFSMAASILGGRLGVSIGVPGELSNAITVCTANFDAAVSVLAGDSRFKAVSTPRIRIRSGGTARLTVGQDVPTLGAVTVPEGTGQSVQSIEYRSSGVILALAPIVRESGTEVLVDQQISDFARTGTGVNNSPTITKRSLSTTVTLANDELIVLGGLTQDKRSEEETGARFLPEFLRSKRNTDNRTEILLLMQVSRSGG